MTNATQSHQEPLTLETLHREILELRERVEDLEDLRDLEEAINENGGKPLIPWDMAKADLNSDERRKSPTPPALAAVFCPPSRIRKWQPQLRTG
jgi:hypothetical protein